MRMRIQIGPDDPRLDVFRDLRSGDGDHRQLAVVEGHVAVRRALSYGVGVELIVCTPTHAATLAVDVPEGPPMFVLPKAELQDLVGYAFHRGCLASVRVPEAGLSPALIARLRAATRVTIVAASGLADPVNVGALVRNSVAFGADACLFDRSCASPYTRRAIRSAMGHGFAGTTFCVGDVEDTIGDLRNQLGVRIYAATPGEGSVALPRVRWAGRRVIVFGQEGAGLPKAVLACADERVCIPMARHVDSLNVAAAAAVILYASQP